MHLMHTAASRQTQEHRSDNADYTEPQQTMQMALVKHCGPLKNETALQEIGEIFFYYLLIEIHTKQRKSYQNPTPADEITEISIYCPLIDICMKQRKSIQITTLAEEITDISIYSSK